MLGVKNHDNESDRLINEIENLREEKNKMIEETSNLIEKYEHLKITSEDFEAKSIAAFKQVDILRNEIDLKLTQNEKLKRRIEELEDILNENIESPDLTKSSVTNSPLTPASDVTPASSITQIKQQRERPNIPSKLVGRNVKPAALSALMDDIADSSDNDKYNNNNNQNNNESDNDNYDDDNSSKNSSVTAIREVLPTNNNNNNNNIQNLKNNNENVELIKQEFDQMKARCQIAEYDANESLKKVITLSSENEVLKVELKEVNEELSLSRQRVDSLQQRLANALNQTKQDFILPNQESRSINGRPPYPAVYNNNMSNNNNDKLSPQNPNYGYNNYDRNGRNGVNGGSDYAGSDYGSVQGIPPSSGRRALVGQRGPTSYYEEGDDALNGWVVGGNGVQTNPEGPSMQRRISAAFSNRLSSFESGTRGINGGGSIHGDDFSVSHVSPNGGIGGGNNGGIYREKDTLICKRMSEWLIKNANIVPSRAATYAVTLVQNGQASLRRLEKSIRKNPDYLLHLGFDDDDADEIAEAINSESLNNNLNNNNSNNNNNNTSRPSISESTIQQQQQQYTNIPTQPQQQFFQQQQPPLQQQQPPPQQQRSSYIPPIDRRSLSPPYQGIGRQTKNENIKYQNSFSGDASVRSYSSLPADFLADPEGMSPDKAFREARLARLEAQAQQAAELAQLASEDADRIAKTYRKGSFLRSNSGMSNSTSPKRRNTNSSTSKKVVAQAHERAYLATARARDTAFLQATENVLNGSH